jgi:ABC-type glycerol-3-phosphate transport system permease component
MSPIVSLVVPTSTAPTLLAYASGLLTDPGVLAVVAVVVGVPFGFYIIKKLISLIPKK